MRSQPSQWEAAEPTAATPETGDEEAALEVGAIVTGDVGTTGILQDSTVLVLVFPRKTQHI